jgi:hypothetical protein
MQPTKLNSTQVRTISRRFPDDQHAKTLFQLIAKHGPQSRQDLVGTSMSVNVSQEFSERVNPRLKPFGLGIFSVKAPGDRRHVYNLFKLEGGA